MERQRKIENERHKDEINKLNSIIDQLNMNVKKLAESNRLKDEQIK